MKDKELKYYTNFAQFLEKYEESENSNIKLVTGESKCSLKNKVDDLSSTSRNPFVHVRNWIKGEILGLESLL
jgi:hypothetical protein